jgi:hypothetical protein
VQVLFQNDSLATLLARVVGILGPIDPELLGKGRDTHKFFTKNHTLYERNQVCVELNKKNLHEFGYWHVNNLVFHLGSMFVDAKLFSINMRVELNISTT